MSDTEIIKEYGTNDITVIWKPKKCIHSEICVKTLPDVYLPKEKPWIRPENASMEALKKQVDQCPSGALTYRMAKEEKSKEKIKITMENKVEVIPNGPLMVHGDLAITKADGSIEMKKRATAFCRCGASANKPFCDGAHKKIGFTDNL